ncbi:SDR family oxidoreductase [Accumulibacter sp.]|uniref:UDP-glucose 4-epimerase family protein n=1 Tax=Accumulibacter sp. TaxID=2053492 RepID=UPI002626F8FB|nr:SDR family oxidoreductase [Accumulibacter sp.]
MRVLVTGANGFVGNALCEQLLREGGHEVVAAVRSASRRTVSGPIRCLVGDIGPHTGWQQALAKVDVVVHLAGRVHVMRDAASDPLAAYRSVNTEGTINLARQAALAGVKRLVFVSTIKVCGEGQAQEGDEPYTERQPAHPSDAYATSKWEAEEGLRASAKGMGLEVVILRPPLIYGPGVGANFLRLMRAVDRGWPLPLGRVRNHRDLIFVGNLVDAVACCLTHPAAADKVFLVADGDGVATPELVRRIAGALDRPARLLPVPAACLRAAGALSGKRQAVERLLGSLRVDDSLIRRTLGWSPPYTVAAGLLATARWYRSVVGG